MGETVEFEPGMRIQMDGKVQVLKCRTVFDANHMALPPRPGWWCDDHTGWGESHMRKHAVVMAPAPKPRSLWSNGAREVMVHEFDDKRLCVCDGDGYCEFKGSAADVGRWLLDEVFCHVEDAGWSCRQRSAASKPAPTNEAPAAREGSRRRVAAAMRTVEREPFGRAIAHALGHIAEREDLTDHEIAGVIAGLRAWEHERTKVAPGRRTLTVHQYEACARAAADASIRESAPHNYLPPHELRVGEVYERARAAC